MSYTVGYSFSAVNDFVHSTGVQYEDLECLCLGMASHIDELKKQINELTQK